MNTIRTKTSNDGPRIFSNTAEYNRLKLMLEHWCVSKSPSVNDEDKEEEPKHIQLSVFGGQFMTYEFNDAREFYKFLDDCKCFGLLAVEQAEEEIQVEIEKEEPLQQRQQQQQHKQNGVGNGIGNGAEEKPIDLKKEDQEIKPIERVEKQIKDDEDEDENDDENDDEEEEDEDNNNNNDEEKMIIKQKKEKTTTTTTVTTTSKIKSKLNKTTEEALLVHEINKADAVNNNSNNNNNNGSNSNNIKRKLILRDKRFGLIVTHYDDLVENAKYQRLDYNHLDRWLPKKNDIEEKSMDFRYAMKTKGCIYKPNGIEHSKTIGLRCANGHWVQLVFRYDWEFSMFLKQVNAMGLVEEMENDTINGYLYQNHQNHHYQTQHNHKGMQLITKYHQLMEKDYRIVLLQDLDQMKDWIQDREFRNEIRSTQEKSSKSKLTWFGHR